MRDKGLRTTAAVIVFFLWAAISSAEFRDGARPWGLYIGLIAWAALSIIAIRLSVDLFAGIVDCKALGWPRFVLATSCLAASMAIVVFGQTLVGDIQALRQEGYRRATSLTIVIVIATVLGPATTRRRPSTD